MSDGERRGRLRRGDGGTTVDIGLLWAPPDAPGPRPHALHKRIRGEQYMLGSCMSKVHVLSEAGLCCVRPVPSGFQWRPRVDDLTGHVSEGIGQIPAKVRTTKGVVKWAIVCTY